MPRLVNGTKRIIKCIQFILFLGGDPNIVIDADIATTKKRTTPLGLIIGSLLYLKRLTKQTAGSYIEDFGSVKDFRFFLLQCAKELLDHNADYNLCYEKSQPQSILYQMVRNELDVLIQHPRIQRYAVRQR